MAEITKQCQALIDAAKDAREELFIEGRHEVAAALLCRNGKIYKGIHINAKYSGFADVCGEIVAVSNAVAHGESQFEAIVALYKDKDGKYKILPPCGRCREVLSDFGRDIKVIIGNIDEPKIVTINELMPFKPESF